MGGVSSANIGNLQQSFMNNITQQSTASCTATVNENVSGSVIIVTGSNIGGSFTGVGTKTNTDASCVMVNNMENSVSSILDAAINQTNTTETGMMTALFPIDSYNEYNVAQSVTNNITQITQTTCAANTVVAKSNNYIYVANTRIGGDFFGVSSESEANASCTMNNLMKTATYNQAQATAAQGNSTKGMFVAIMGTFAMIIGVIVIGVIILFAIGAIGSVGAVGATTAVTSS